MTFIQSWRDSLRIFLPAQFKSFFNSTFELFKSGYVTWMRYWWIFFIFAMAGSLAKSSNLLPFFLFHGHDVLLRMGPLSGIDIIDALFTIIFFITLYLSMRYAQNMKDFGYALRYIPHGVVIGVWGVCLALIVAYVIAPLAPVPQSSLLATFLGYGLITLYGIAISWVTAFFMLFLFDSQDNVLVACVPSLYRALTMVVYNLPFCLIMGFVLLLLYYGWLFTRIRLGVDTLVFLPLVAAIFTNFYIKKTQG